MAVFLRASGRWRMRLTNAALTLRGGAAQPCARRQLSSKGDAAVPVPKLRVSAYDRMILRLTKSVKNGEVPSEVSAELMDKANSRFRIGMMGVMMVFCLCGSIVAVRAGKRDLAANRNTVRQRNRERYAKLEGSENK